MNSMLFENLTTLITRKCDYIQKLDDEMRELVTGSGREMVNTNQCSWLVDSAAYFTTRP